MYFKIIKHVGETPSHHVSNVRQFELVQVHPWMDWTRNDDGIETNYFVYTSLHNYDLYVDIDREFLNMYKNSYLADMMLNIVNEEIDRFFTRSKGKWIHKFGMVDIVNIINKLKPGDKIDSATMDEIGDFLEKRFKELLSQPVRGAKIMKSQNDWLAEKGIEYYGNSTNMVLDFKKGDFYYTMTFKPTYWNDEIWVTDEKLINDIKAAYDKQDLVREISNENIQRRKAIEEMKKHGGARAVDLDDVKQKRVPKYTEKELLLIKDYNKRVDDDGNTYYMNIIPRKKVYHEIECKKIFH